MDSSQIILFTGVLSVRFTLSSLESVVCPFKQDHCFGDGDLTDNCSSPFISSLYYSSSFIDVIKRRRRKNSKVEKFNRHRYKDTENGVEKKNIFFFFRKKTLIICVHSGLRRSRYPRSTHGPANCSKLPIELKLQRDYNYRDIKNRRLLCFLFQFFLSFFFIFSSEFQLRAVRVGVSKFLSFFDYNCLIILFDYACNS